MPKMPETKELKRPVREMSRRTPVVIAESSRNDDFGYQSSPRPL
jgi:hypothetical protein